MVLKLKYKLAAGLLLLVFAANGKEVPVEMAKLAAANFLSDPAVTTLKGIHNYTFTRVPFSTIRTVLPGQKKSVSIESSFYVFDLGDPEGFIIVSGDDRVTPILGYSFENDFDPDGIPDNMRKWMEGYRKQIMYTRTHPGEASGDALKQWETLLSGGTAREAKSTHIVEPLLTSVWNQSPYFNDLCPFDATEGERTVTGCSATAMAQIMYYWNYPARGTGFHSYRHVTYGTLSANFGGTQYKWEDMTDDVQESNNAVARLMYHCAVSIETDFGVASEGGSGAYVISDQSARKHCVEYALKTYFKYDPSLHGIIRSDYSDSEWLTMLKGELDEGRPIEYAGFGLGGGHAFVCDGYDANDFFHFNWGWGGLYNGYFLVNALNPGETGIGGGSGSYNSSQHALIGIRPREESIGYDLKLYDSLSLSENPLYFLDPHVFHTDIANYGTETFSGDFCTAIFDKEVNFIEYTEILEGNSLEGEMHYTAGLDFSNPGSLNLLPGDYSASVFYRETGGNWNLVSDDFYPNDLEFNVFYAADIELYKDLVISTGTTTITQYAPFSVTADILNNGSAVFSGEFSVDLYDMEGEWAATVEIVPGDSLAPDFYYPDVVFSSGGVSVDPGTYLMALFHKPEGGDWTLSGSTFFTNPVKVVVKQAPLSADMYENNDDPESAYFLPTIYTGDSTRLMTTGSNIHLGSDMDYYYIMLEEGYDYTVTTRVHDAFDSGNGEIYSNDVIWAYYDYSSDDWSDFYDDVPDHPILMENGGWIYFVVAPYYEGQKGTYLLDIRIKRTEIVGITPEESSGLRLYPNPTPGKVFMESDNVIDLIEVVDAGGRLIRSVNASSVNPVLDLSGLKSGTYFIRVTRGKDISIHKIIRK